MAIDPAGEHNSENAGNGTTGLAYSENGEVISLSERKASDYRNTLDYWKGIFVAIDNWNPHHVIIEGYRLYNHRGMSAQTQSNSTLMTPQLIGAIRMFLYQQNIPYTIQYASEVKTRWSDEILIANGYLEEGNLFKGKQTNAHKRDALRHLVHYLTYKAGDAK